MEMSAWQTNSQLINEFGEGPCSAALWLPHGLCSEPRHLEPHHEHGHAPSGCTPLKMLALLFATSTQLPLVAKHS